MAQIFHIAPSSELPRSPGAYPFRPSSLAGVGFVHCALGPSVIPVANDYFADVSAELLLIRIDPERLAAELRYEAPAPIEGGGTDHLESASVFPHIYGPIDREAITGIAPLGRTTDGYAWPTAFLSLDEFAQQEPAGEFSAWLLETRHAQQETVDVPVPCGDCTACCRSSYFVHIGADESRTLKRIPRQLRFPAPGEPAGNVLMGFDERGHCPMLVDDRCSIYADRPRTCRTYDCRIFPATDISVASEDKPLIAERARRWRFEHPTAGDQSEHISLRSAAAYLRDHAEAFGGAVPQNATQLAVLAIKVHDTFTQTQDPEAEPATELIEAVRRANPRFENNNDDENADPLSPRA